MYEIQLCPPLCICKKIVYHQHLNSYKDNQECVKKIQIRLKKHAKRQVN